MAASPEELAKGVKMAEQEMDYRVDLFNRLLSEHTNITAFCIFVVSSSSFNQHWSPSSWLRIDSEGLVLRGSFVMAQDGLLLLREVHGQEVQTLWPGCV